MRIDMWTWLRYTVFEQNILGRSAQLAETLELFGDRLTVGLWFLVPTIGVRVPVPEPRILVKPTRLGR